MIDDLVVRLRDLDEISRHERGLIADEIDRLHAENMKLLAENALSDVVRIKDLEIQLGARINELDQVRRHRDLNHNHMMIALKRAGQAEANYARVCEGIGYPSLESQGDATPPEWAHQLRNRAEQAEARVKELEQDRAECNERITSRQR